MSTSAVLLGGAPPYFGGGPLRATPRAESPRRVATPPAGGRDGRVSPGRKRVAQPASPAGPARGARAEACAAAAVDASMLKA